MSWQYERDNGKPQRWVENNAENRPFWQLLYLGSFDVSSADLWRQLDCGERSDLHWIHGADNKLDTLTYVQTCIMPVRIGSCSSQLCTTGKRDESFGLQRQCTFLSSQPAIRLQKATVVSHSFRGVAVFFLGGNGGGLALGPTEQTERKRGSSQMSLQKANGLTGTNSSCSPVRCFVQRCVTSQLQAQPRVLTRPKKKKQKQEGAYTSLVAVPGWGWSLAALQCTACTSDPTLPAKI